jgi:hypothetical protein
MEQEQQAPPPPPPADYSTVETNPEPTPQREKFRSPRRAKKQHISETLAYRNDLKKARAEQNAKQDSVLMDMEEDIENELSLLESIETKE